MKDIITKLAAYNGATEIQNGANTSVGGSGDVGGAIIGILNGVIGLLAVVCVIVIVTGGVQYMTSSGDAGKVKKAKDTILYAIIGLVVCALAATIVNFVIANLPGVKG